MKSVKINTGVGIKEMYEYLERGKRMKLKESTLVVHRFTLNEFFIFLNENYPDIKNITDVTRDVVLSYEKY